MNHVTPEESSPGATRETSSLDGSSNGLPPYLDELDPRQWTLTRTAAMDTVLRGWDDGSVDTLIVLSPETAVGQRDNHLGRAVHQERGRAVETARVMQRLPAPGTPDAPVDELPEVPGPEREM
jgi:hypothetical protein